MTIRAAADGSSLGNPGATGWAWFISEDAWQAGGAAEGTNNVGELTAVLQLLRATRQAGRSAEELVVCCDSQYVINAMTKWIHGWKRNGWRTAAKKPVANADLIRAIDEELAGRQVRFEWVRGHAGHELNEAADARARACALAYQEGREPESGPGLGESGGCAEPPPDDLAAPEEEMTLPLWNGVEMNSEEPKSPSGLLAAGGDAKVSQTPPSAGFHATSRYRQHGIYVTEHRLEVPLDHARPDGPAITIFARELSTTLRDDPCASKPALLFLQGGPGGRGPRPGDFRDGWVGHALENHRVILLDQRGTGLSTRLDSMTLAAIGTPREQADYLKCFRADSIVADAELLRHAINDGKPWATLGQSYGGFISLTYLSRHPEAITNAYFTGGLPGLTRVDDIYRRTYLATARRNATYFQRYPEDEGVLRDLLVHLQNHEEFLPTGERLTPGRLRMLGLLLGSQTGFDTLHYFFEGPFTMVNGQTRLSSQFLDQVWRQVSMGDSPLYALMHETIYAGATPALAGQATNWAAHRLLDEVGHTVPEGFSADFDARDTHTPIYLTGEHIYPWLFDEDPALTPMREVADLLAADTDWQPLYDPTALAECEVPAAAAVYYDDMFVPADLSLATAGLTGIHTWVTSEYQHDGLRADGKRVLAHLMEMVKQ